MGETMRGRKVGALCAAVIGATLLAGEAYAQSVTTDLSAGFYPDPQYVATQASGRVCRRDRDDPPALTVNYTAGDYDLYFFAQSGSDTTLAVRGPNGFDCNDDSNGLDPGITIRNPQSGRYEVWVGRFLGNGTPTPANVFVSELGRPGQNSGRQKAPPPPPPPRDPLTDAEFQAALRAVGPPSAVTAEDQRRAVLQAEALVGAARVDEAANIYRDALQRMPNWSAGHYNFALVLAELGRHSDAITAMRRYLYLEPSAPDARAAQDQIYRWEILLDSGAK